MDVFAHLQSLSCKLWFQKINHGDSFLCYPHVYMHACPNARHARLYVRYACFLPSLRGFACWVKIMRCEEARSPIKHIFTIFRSLPCLTKPVLGWASTVVYHSLEFHQHVVLFPATNAMGRQDKTLSLITRELLYILKAPNLDVNATGDRKANFILTFG